MLYTGVGFQTPCYSNLSTYLVPDETTSPDVWLVTASVFARSYQLIDPEPRHENGLAPGAIAGLVAGLAIAVLLLIGLAIWWFVARRRRSRPPPTPATREASPGPAPSVPDAGRTVAPQPIDLSSVPPRYSPVAESRSPRSRHQARAGAIHELPDIAEHPVYRDDPVHQERLQDVAMREAGFVHGAPDHLSEPQTPASAFAVLRDPENDGQIDTTHRKSRSMSSATGDAAQASILEYYSRDYPSPLTRKS